MSVNNSFSYLTIINEGTVTECVFGLGVLEADLVDDIIIEF